MKTLATSTSSSVSSSSSSFPFLKQRFLSPPEFISFRRPPISAFTGIGIQHFIYLTRRRSLGVLSCVASDEKAETHIAAVENQDADQSKTVRVKFQLQKECTFGEQFLVVGDDPSFGSWDVSNAIPLNWSDGHQWEAELDISVGKTIQFKFLLQGKTGDIVWQPGPDRIFKSWETTNTIVVSEDWDSAESQMLIEEDQIVIQNDELVHNTDQEPPVVHIDTSTAQKPLIDGCNIFPSEENAKSIVAENISYPLIDGCNIFPSEENAKSIVAENISYPNESFIVNPNIEANSEVYNNSNGGKFEVYTLNSNTKITEEILKDGGKDETVKNLESADVEESSMYYGVPMLVPGLPPTPAISNDASTQDDVEKYIPVDGFNESKDHKIPEMDEKQGPYIVAEQEMEMTKSNYEDNLQRESTRETNAEKIENRSDLQPFDDNILQNDMTWGQKTLLKFFNNLRFLWHQSY